MSIDPAALLAEGVAALTAAKVAVKDQPVWLPAIAAMLASVTNATLSAASPTWPQAVALASGYGTEVVNFHLAVMRDTTRTPGERAAAADRLCSLLRLL